MSNQNYISNIEGVELNFKEYKFVITCLFNDNIYNSNFDGFDRTDHIEHLKLVCNEFIDDNEYDEEIIRLQSM